MLPEYPECLRERNDHEKESSGLRPEESGGDRSSLSSNLRLPPDLREYQKARFFFSLANSSTTRVRDPLCLKENCHSFTPHEGEASEKDRSSSHVGTSSTWHEMRRTVPARFYGPKFPGWAKKRCTGKRKLVAQFQGFSPAPSSLKEA